VEDGNGVIDVVRLGVVSEDLNANDLISYPFRSNLQFEIQSYN